MAAFTFKLGGLDLSSYLRVNPDDKMDPQGAAWIEPAFTETPFADGQPLLSTTVNNREQMWPLFLRDATGLKDQLHALIRAINQAAGQRPLVLEWADAGASASTFYDCQFVRFDPDFNYRRSVHGYGAGVLHVWTSGYGHTGTTRVCATAQGSGVLLQVPIPSVAGDAPALMAVTITAGQTVASTGRVVALAPITNPSYVPYIPFGSLTDLEAGASVRANSLFFRDAGVTCKVPLPNPTIAGGDNRILAIAAKSNLNLALTALDPYGNVMGGTALATSFSWTMIDLGVCRLPTVGYPTQPKLSLVAGSGLLLSAVLCLPDKNLALIPETGQTNWAAWDSYVIDGVAGDSYRVASSGAFGGQKLVGVQRGMFPKLQPSTTSVAVVCLPDRNAIGDTLSAVVSVKERFTYGA